MSTLFHSTKVTWKKRKERKTLLSVFTSASCPDINTMRASLNALTQMGPTTTDSPSWRNGENSFCGERRPESGTGFRYRTTLAQGRGDRMQGTLHDNRWASEGVFLVLFWS